MTKAATAPMLDHATILGHFEAIASASPARPAIYSQSDCLSYGELDRRANQVAHVLRSKGVKPNTVVAISAPRSPEMLIALFGILKAGGAYMPLAPGSPPLRRARMLRDTQAVLLLTDAPTEQADEIDTPVLLLSDPVFTNAPVSRLDVRHSGSDLIYVIFTSGTTGHPKGVMLEHRGVLNRLVWMQNRYPLSDTDVILQKTPFIFDVSVWELFWWSMYGASVALLGPQMEKFPWAIADAVAAHRVTIMHFVPSMFSMFLHALAENPEARTKLSSLRRLFASGEALTVAHVELFRRLFDAECRIGFTNLYGPTEAAIDVSYFDCPAGPLPARIPIGRQIDGIQLHVMRSGREQPPGEDGELCIGGVGLARGYINQPAMTAAAFVPNPFQPGERLYRTGDLARRSENGELEFLGRLDHQIKIRGLRIELGEIENNLAAHPGVAGCCVAVAQLSETVPQISAYLVVRDEGLRRKTLLQYLQRRLPDYMIPNRFLQVQALPLTPSGKTDRRALSGLTQAIPLAD
ncbi:amino acid adenylation domain-containing protein [Bradyrhizobium ontarionense]|uniref:Amino acid adenylation domain-containing protein n=1 Tax=Bradyrhizobium ontarionense TaxID=2898149 RepID=A0ABY3RA20_9BRAD|nr:amino acid adenylation domain-containing protein [Bradyrhizobium sp. A19]UFZ04093.1 amino acid adenylation domain-containing protein [Bradyrhizobium sp. A19]